MRASDRLTDSAVCLVAPEFGPDRQLEKLLAGAGRLTSVSKPILEVNPRHELVVALAALGEDERAFKEDAAHLLFDEARVLDGDRPTRCAHVLRAARPGAHARPSQARRVRRGRCGSKRGQVTRRR